MRNKLIVIDAGHGMGNRRPGLLDPGAVRYEGSKVQGPPRSSEPILLGEQFIAPQGAINRAPARPDSLERGPTSKVVATEAEWALRYALALDAALRAHGFQTRLTRQDHQTPCSLQDRLEAARKNSAALLVSLHLNASPQPPVGAGLAPPGAQQAAPLQASLQSAMGNRKKPRGHEVLYRTAGSAPIAQAISRALAPHIPAHGAGLVSRAGLYVLQYDPSVLVELGFIDSDQDYALLADDQFKAAATESVATAIAGAFESSKFQVPSSKSEVSAARAGTWNLELGTGN